MKHRGMTDGLQHIGCCKLMEAEKVEEGEWLDRGVERVPDGFILSQPQHIEEERQPRRHDAVHSGKASRGSPLCTLVALIQRFL
jgi:hypothetical protein